MSKFVGSHFALRHTNCPAHVEIGLGLPEWNMVKMHGGNGNIGEEEGGKGRYQRPSVNILALPKQAVN
jgi:hypothetical protein